MDADKNELVTRIGPGTPCGALMRRYWQPAALLDEFDARLDPRMADRPVKPVRLLGQDLVLFRDGTGRYGLIDRHCPHRGADLAFGRLEPEGLRCPFRGWKFDVAGTCPETPAEAASLQTHTRGPPAQLSSAATGRRIGRMAGSRGLDAGGAAAL